MCFFAIITDSAKSAKKIDNSNSVACFTVQREDCETRR